MVEIHHCGVLFKLLTPSSIIKHEKCPLNSSHLSENSLGGVSINPITLFEYDEVLTDFSVVIMSKNVNAESNSFQKIDSPPQNWLRIFFRVQFVGQLNSTKQDVRLGEPQQKEMEKGKEDRNIQV